MGSEADNNRGHIAKYWLYYFFIVFESVLIIFYSQFTEFRSNNGSNNEWTDDEAELHVSQVYPFLADISVMIFVGFGFLLTVSRGFGWSAVGLNFLLAAGTIQWSILCNGFWAAAIEGTWKQSIGLDIWAFITGDYTAWSVIIAFGAVYGRLSFIQYVVMATIHTIFFSLSWQITQLSFVANDIGGGMNVHAFGALFGLAVSAVAGRKEAKRTTTYNSSLFAVIGTLFLWIYFPSFNAGNYGNSNLRGIINTILSLTGSCFMTCLFTPLIKDGKMRMEYLLNATLAGGVILGSTADIILQPWVSFFLGCLAGVVSVLGFEYIVPFVNNKLKIQDSNGVLALHGINGILAGCISAVVAGTATLARYGNSLNVLFPAIALGRTAGHQGGYQLATLAMVISLSIVTGVLTGFVLLLPIFNRIQTPFDDEEFWTFEADQLAEHKKTDGHHQVVEIKVSEAINSE